MFNGTISKPRKGNFLVSGQDFLTTGVITIK